MFRKNKYCCKNVIEYDSNNKDHLQDSSYAVHVHDDMKIQFCHDVISQRRSISLHEIFALEYTRVFFDIEVKERSDILPTQLAQISENITNFLVTEFASHLSCDDIPVVFTCSTKCDSSVHVIYPSLFIKTKEIANLKNFITIGTKNYPEFKFIDTSPYRKEGSLRFPLTLKERLVDNRDVSKDGVHYPHELRRDGNEVKLIRYKYEAHTLLDFILTWDDMTHQFVTMNNKNPPILLDLSKWESKQQDDDKEPSEFFNLSYGDKMIKLHEYISGKMKHSWSYTSRAPQDDNILPFSTFEFKLNVPEKCNICKKKVHKNSHSINLLNSKLIVKKYGNPKSCRTIVEEMDNLLMNIDDLNEVVHGFIDKHVVKYNNDLYMLVDRWIEINKETKLVYAIVQTMPPQTTIKGLTSVEKRLLDFIEAVYPSINLPDQNYKLPTYVIAFNNVGVDVRYDECVANDKYFTPCYIDKSYLSLKKIPAISKGYEKAMKILHSIIDSIMPRTSGFRIQFEIVLASCLLMEHKNKIEIFLGATSTGKSTIKKMLEHAFCSMFVSMSANSLLSGTHSSDRPSPDLASLGNKRVVFGSELPKNQKTACQSVKLLTENDINARQLYSNKTKHSNKATIIIDTNFPLAFDTEDSALIKRIRTTKFGSFFVNPVDINKRKVLGCGRRAEIADPSVVRFVSAPFFHEVFIDYLIVLYKKHYDENGMIKTDVNVVEDDSDKIRKVLDLMFVDGGCGSEEDASSYITDMASGRILLERQVFELYISKLAIPYDKDRMYEIYRKEEKYHSKSYFRHTATSEDIKSSIVKSIKNVCNNIFSSTDVSEDGVSVKHFLEHNEIKHVYDETDPDIVLMIKYINETVPRENSANIKRILESININRFARDSKDNRG